MAPDLGGVWRAWAACDRLHQLGVPAADDAIAEAESRLGRRLPESMKAMYRFSDGFSAFEGLLPVEPLGVPEPAGSFGGLVRYSDFLRDAHWPIPDELVVFASDGSDGLFGCWLPQSWPGGDDAPVIEVAEEFDAPGLAVVATTLAGFLEATTVYCVQLLEAGAEPLDVLDAPASLRSDDPDEDLHFGCLRWASPDLPDPEPDPYERPVPVEELRRLFGG